MRPCHKHVRFEALVYGKDPEFYCTPLTRTADGCLQEPFPTNGSIFFYRARPSDAPNGFKEPIDSLYCVNPIWGRPSFMFRSVEPLHPFLAHVRAQPPTAIWHCPCASKTRGRLCPETCSPTQCYGDLFAHDFAAMRANMAPLRNELLRRCMHPSRLYQARHHWLLF
jgi:hypothetical protein